MKRKTKAEKEALDTKLEAYAGSGYYPFHMPGHKRNALPMPNPYTIDITEIEGFDNLHYPEGILKEAQERAAQLYGAGQSFYLVNGSTCGLLAAVAAAVPQGKTILMARNAHRAAYHAACIRNLSAEYVYPGMTEFGIAGSIDPQEVKRQLEKNPEIRAVLVTSPTYEGVVSDIAAIAKTVHSYGIPLIVDEAHGAHFGFHKAFPQSAVRMGADIVVQSMHKVLPSLTQTALLHLNSSCISAKEIRKYLAIFETSSPSYVLMAGMEKCIRLLAGEGESLFAAYAGLLDEFYRRTEGLSRLHVMRRRDFTEGEIYGLDPSKLVLSVRDTGWSGALLYQKLLKAYRLQMELVSGFYVLGMTSILDRREGFQRLWQALWELDETIPAGKSGCMEQQFIQQLYAPKEKCMEFCEAMDRKTEMVSFDEATGHISGCMVSLYPPGIPVLLPGERIDAAFLKNIRKCRKFRLNVQGIADIINERIEIIR